MQGRVDSQKVSTLVSGDLSSLVIAKKAIKNLRRATETKRKIGGGVVTKRGMRA